VKRTGLLRLSARSIAIDHITEQYLSCRLLSRFREHRKYLPRVSPVTLAEAFLRRLPALSENANSTIRWHRDPWQIGRDEASLVRAEPDILVFNGDASCFRLFAKDFQEQQVMGKDYHVSGEGLEQFGATIADLFGH
jgi:hypothetical protein